MTSYATYQPSLYPTALADPYGQSWGRSQGAMKDRLATLAADAVDMGLVLRCPDDALPYLGEDTQILPVPGMGPDRYRRRIAAVWDTWPWAGTRRGLLTVAGLAADGATDAVIYTAREWGLLAEGLWARWWLVIPTAEHGYAPDGAWDDAGDYDDGGTWDSDATPDEVRARRSLVRQFTNARDLGHLRFSFPGTDYYDDGGVWDSPADDWNDEPTHLEVRV